jgi:hypothetical protein
MRDSPSDLAQIRGCAGVLWKASGGDTDLTLSPRRDPGHRRCCSCCGVGNAMETAGPGTQFAAESVYRLPVRVRDEYAGLLPTQPRL